MSQRTLNLKLDVAARLKVFGRDGEAYVARFCTPGTNTIVLPGSGSFERAYVNVEPLAGTPWTQTVDFQGQAVASVEGERPAPHELIISAGTTPLASAPRVSSQSIRHSTDFAGLGPNNAVAEPDMTPSEAHGLTPFFWVGASSTPVYAHSDPPKTAAPPPPPVRVGQLRFSLGLSTDAKPFDYGGWGPFKGPWPVHVSEVDSRVRIEIQRGDVTEIVRPEDGSRIRATLAAENSFVERFLLPLYGGGVRIDLVAECGAFAPRCHVRPVDPELYALQQALEDGSDEEGGIVWAQFSAQHDIERYVRDDSVCDPWTVILVLLAHDRFRSIALPCPQEWCDTMASRFGWISDFLILQAHYSLRCDPERSLGRSGSHRALELLRRARHIGAPYFAGANQMLLRLLSGLTDMEFIVGTAKVAQTEMARWWRLLDNQSANGVLFAWRLDNGARTQGNLDKRYSTVIARGAVADGVVRQLTKARTQPSGTAADPSALTAPPLLQVVVEPAPTQTFANSDNKRRRNLPSIDPTKVERLAETAVKVGLRLEPGRIFS